MIVLFLKSINRIRIFFFQAGEINIHERMV